MSATKVQAQLGDAKFFKSYTIIMTSAYLVILVGLVSFFYHQLRQEFAFERKIIETQVDVHGQSLQHFFQAFVDQVEMLRMSAELAAIVALDDDLCNQDSTEIAIFHKTPKGFDFDNSLNRDLGGNLIGVGSLYNQRSAFYCDLQLTMSLRDGLQSLVFTMPGANNGQFISKQNFHLVSPWLHSSRAPFNEQLYQEPVWQIGQKRAMVDRRPFWAPAIFGGDHVGLLVPMATPVFVDNRFSGILSINLSLDYLNRYNGQFGYHLGTQFIVDGQGAVLAHPTLYANPLKIREVSKLSSAVPSKLFESLAALKELPHGRAVSIKNHVVVVHQLAAVPWNLVFVVPEVELQKKILLKFGLPMTGLLICLALVMYASYAVTSRLFVRPSAHLVEHVSNESKFTPQPYPSVPKNWQPWFEVITRVFRESLALLNLQREIDIAARMQESILPRSWPTDSRYALWGTMTPAKSVGGDFYDHFSMANEQRGLVVADVSGKGISAGLFSMVSKTHIRSLAMYAQLSVEEVIADVNDSLCENNETCMFVTVFYGQYDPATGDLAMVNAGHPPQLLVHADGTVRWINSEKPCLALGLLEGAAYTRTTLTLLPGDQLMIFSDGVNEAMSLTNEEFGLERLSKLFEGNPADSAQAAVERILKEVERHAQGAEQSDDITCLALHRLS